MYTFSPLNNSNCNNKNKFYANVQCVLCDSCYWSASFLIPVVRKHIIYACPLCNNHNLSLIPLENDESYRLTIEARRGLEIEFSRQKVNVP